MMTAVPDKLIISITLFSSNPKLIGRIFEKNTPNANPSLWCYANTTPSMHSTDE
jgi:hypothetical protein